MYRHEVDEKARTLKRWVRRKRGIKVLTCSGCGGRWTKITEIRHREVRDLPWRKYQTTVVEFHRVHCLECGLKVETIPQLPSKAPFSKDFEDALGLSCERPWRGRWHGGWVGGGDSAAIDQHYLERWAKSRKKPVLRQMGIDEIYLGKTQKFLAPVSNLETGEPLWFGQDRKRETLDEFFRKELSGLRRGRIAEACVDMRSPRASLVGRRSTGLCTTNFTSCNMPARRWIEVRRRSSCARVAGYSDWSKANARCRSAAWREF